MLYSSKGLFICLLTSIVLYILKIGLIILFSENNNVV